MGLEDPEIFARRTFARRVLVAACYDALAVRRRTAIGFIVLVGCGGAPESIDLTVEFQAPVDFREACEVLVGLCRPDWNCGPWLGPPGNCPEARVTSEGEVVTVVLDDLEPGPASLTVEIATDETICFSGADLDLRHARQAEVVSGFECDPR